MEEPQSSLTIPPSTSGSELAVTAEQIITAHKEVVDVTWRLMETGNRFVEKAAAVGRLLLVKKEELGHGSWLPWLAENVKEFGHDTARDYMKAARYYDQNRNLQPESGPITMQYIKNLKQAAGMLEDKPPAKEEQEKPAFVIRCAFNIEPEKLDEVQRRTAFDQAKPMLSVFETFGFIEIKV